MLRWKPQIFCNFQSKPVSRLSTYATILWKNPGDTLWNFRKGWLLKTLNFKNSTIRKLALLVQQRTTWNYLEGRGFRLLGQLGIHGKRLTLEAAVRFDENQVKCNAKTLPGQPCCLATVRLAARLTLFDKAMLILAFLTFAVSLVTWVASTNFQA